MESRTELKKGLSRLLIILGVIWVAPCALGFLLTLAQILANPPQGPAAGDFCAVPFMIAILGFPGFLILLSGILGLRNASAPAKPAAESRPRSSAHTILGGVLGFITGYLAGWMSAPLLAPAFGIRPGDIGGFITVLTSLIGLALGMYLSDRPRSIGSTTGDLK